MAMHPTTAESLFARCDRSQGPDSCWIWKGRVSRRYGVISIGDHPVRAHRAAWLLTRGEIPARLVVCHRCDQPLCCNPDHLWLGTVLDNNRDCRAKGRHSHGDRHPDAKLSEDQVMEIRRLMLTDTPRRQIAERFGTSIHNVYRIAGGYSWKHLLPTVVAREAA